MKMMKLLRRPAVLIRRRQGLVSASNAPVKNLASVRAFSACSEGAELKDFMDYLDSLKNYEKSGVPRGAGTDSDEGFDLGRMRRLMERLGNPQSKFKAIHIAGTKGKGSTAAFVSNILRTEGYAVGCYTSPHIQTIRERMSVGRSGEPISAEALNGLFQRVRTIVDRAIGLEKGRISHFEVLTAMAFTLFAQENVDIAVIEAGLGGARDATNIIDSSGLTASVITTIGREHLDALGGSLESIAIAKSGIIKYNRPVVLGGPFLSHIERILREQASSMQSPVVSASDSGIRSTVKGYSVFDGTPCQSCDISVQIEKDFPLLLELSNVKLRMLGRHQLQNAATATLVALCLRNQGWRISDDSIRAGLEKTVMVGRSQFLTSKEAEALGLPGAMILLDGAHTNESAKALMDMMDTAFPEAHLALVVAMAADKDHVGFAREMLSGRRLEAVFLTEADIAGGSSRTTSASSLRDCWIQVSEELGIGVLHGEMTGYEKLIDSEREKTVLAAESSFSESLEAADRILRTRSGNRARVVVVTGSLHLASLVLGSVHSKVKAL